MRLVRPVRRGREVLGLSPLAFLARGPVANAIAGQVCSLRRTHRISRWRGGLLITRGLRGIISLPHGMTRNEFYPSTPRNQSVQLARGCRTCFDFENATFTSSSGDERLACFSPAL